MMDRDPALPGDQQQIIHWQPSGNIEIMNISQQTFAYNNLLLLTAKQQNRDSPFENVLLVYFLMDDKAGTRCNHFTDEDKW